MSAALDADAILDRIEKQRTPPFDPRYPNCNQSKYCWQNYVDFHRCETQLGKAGEDTRVCALFKKNFKSLCPNDWVEKWDSQREEGVFPGKL